MLVPNRHGSSNSYRYGFQGQEKDDELKGEGNSLNYTFRMHDPRVGRFFATDPLEKKYPYLSPYQFSSNQPIHAHELEGCESSDEFYQGNYASDDMMDLQFNLLFGWVGDARAGVKNLTSRLLGTDRRFKGDGTFGTIEIPKEESSTIAGDLFDVTIGVVSSRYGFKGSAVFSVKTGATTIRELRVALANKIGADVKYINFSKAVFTKRIEANVELVQYRLKAGTKGDYYAPKGTTPEEIGLRSEDVQQTFLVTLNKPVDDVLVSTHIANKAPYYNPKLPKLKGKGTQYTSKKIKEEGVATWKEIENPK
jgi:RHS repeat-associated protein